MRILYFNGLGEGELRAREEIAFRHLGKHGHTVTHTHINWLEKRPLRQVLDEQLGGIRAIMRHGGKLALVGSSAGGSLVVNLMQHLQAEQGVFSVTLCSRLHPGPLKSWDQRTLGIMAHLGIEGAESRLFYDSVIHCSEVAIPALKPGTLRRIRVVQQIADFVVPRTTMDIPGVEPTRVAGIGHGMGIAMGVVALPKILEEFDPSTASA